MAAFQIESNICTGRGFVDTSPSGYCAKFKNWIVKPPASGGPGWTILLDRSNPSPCTSSAMVGSVITSSGHGFYTNEYIYYTGNGTAMGGLSLNTYYCIYKLDDNNFKLSTSRYQNAVSGLINITGSGTGTHTFTLTGPYILFSDVAAPSINQSCKMMSLGYWTGDPAYVRFQSFLGWDHTKKIASAYWDGHKIATLDAAGFAYDFRGGSECMILQARIGTTWTSCGMDTWTGDGNLLEGVDKSGVLMDTVLAATGCILTLNNSGAYNFTSGEYYYLCDFSSGHMWANYGKCIGVNGPSNQITLDYVYNNFPSGSIIAAYPYRYFGFGDLGYYNGQNFAPLHFDMNHQNANSTIPLISSTTSGYVFQNGASLIWGGLYSAQMGTYISTMSPNDKNQYALEKINILESTSQNFDHSYSNPYPGNRAYGSSNNILCSYLMTMAAAQDGRSYAGKNYLYFKAGDQYMPGGGYNYAWLFLDTESLS